MHADGDEDEEGMLMQQTENLMIQIKSFKSQTRGMLFFMFVFILIVAAVCVIMLLEIMDLDH